MSKHLLTMEQNFMNTQVIISVVQDAQSTVEIQKHITQAFGEFDRIVKKYTRFNENSELSNLNRNSGSWVAISAEFFELIEYMLDLATKTNGVFDPTIIDFLELYGYSAKQDYSALDTQKLKQDILERVKVRPSYKEIELDKPNLKVKLAPTQRIDLGGIGKGYAIDCACQTLSNISSNFIVNAGGDVRAAGTNQDGQKWKIDLITQVAGKKESVGVLEISDQSVASSGSWARKVKNFHHIINPKDGEPVQADYSTVFVLSEKSIDSDAWATALFVDRSLEKICPYMCMFE